MKMSLLEQYASVHHIRDILRFSSALIDSEILSGAEVDEFLGTKFLIPSPSCGTFDVRSFLKIFETLEDSARAYWNDGYTPYDHPYQSRVCSFLLERLNSYLLVKHLAKENQALEDVAGSTIVISDGLRIGPGVVEGG